MSHSLFGQGERKLSHLQSNFAQRLRPSLDGRAAATRHERANATAKWLRERAGIHPQSAWLPFGGQRTKTLTADVLLHGETIVADRAIDVRLPDILEDPHQVLARLCGVQDPTEIGAAGPVLGAAAPPGNQDPELHLYEALFGRDALVVADLVGDRYPRLAEATVRRLAELQATEFDQASDAEPGRIPHEVRHPEDPRARQITQSNGWGWPYYGTVDAPPLFVLVAGEAERRSPGFLAGDFIDRRGDRRPLVDAVALALAWTLRRLDSASGMIESVRARPGGHLNQVWKDSWDSYHHSDGTVARPDTVASVEVAAYAFGALREAARLVARYPRASWPATADKLEQAALRLRLRLIELTWVNEGRYFAAGVDRGPAGELRQLRIRTSNMGRLLDSEILEGPEWRSHREAIIAHMFSDSMLASVGIRTLAAGEARYRPGSYHNGSVWPFDSRLIARGLERHGHPDLAAELDRRLLDTCQETRCYPEVVRGNGARPEINRRVVDIIDGEGRGNRVEQPPQLLQAWTVAAVVSTGRDPRHLQGD